MPESPKAKRGRRERRAEKQREKELRTGPSPERLDETQKRAGGGDDVKSDVKAAASRAGWGGGG